METVIIPTDTASNLCKDCFHKDLCKYQDILKDMKLDSSLDLSEIENPFNLTLDCELKKTVPTR